MGEKVDFHLLVEDKEDEEEASLPVLLPLLLPDFLPSGGKEKDGLALSSRSARLSFYFYFSFRFILTTRFSFLTSFTIP